MACPVELMMSGLRSLKNQIWGRQETVVNLPDHLTEEETVALCKRLNIAIPPKRMLKEAIITQQESSEPHPLKEQKKYDIRPVECYGKPKNLQITFVEENGKSFKISARIKT